MKTTQQKGFTLIELLVVISIISFLSSIILSGFQSARMKARDSERIQEMRSLRTALGLYQSDQNQFPPVGGAVETVLAGLSPAYISSLPTDPNFIGFDGYQYCNINTSNCLNGGDTLNDTFSVRFRTEVANSFVNSDRYGCLNSIGLENALGSGASSYCTQK